MNRLMINGSLILNISLDSLLWNMLLIVFFMGAIVGAVIFYFYSKNPEEWVHQPRIDGGYHSGRLKSLAHSIRLSASEDVSDTPLRQFIQTIFFEKYRTIKGISPADLIDMEDTDAAQLRQLIRDEDITNWLCNIRKGSREQGVGIVTKKKVSKKEHYLMDISSILDKMEAWGE